MSAFTFHERFSVRNLQWNEELTGGGQTVCLPPFCIPSPLPDSLQVTGENICVDGALLFPWHRIGAAGGRKGVERDTLGIVSDQPVVERLCRFPGETDRLEQRMAGNERNQVIGLRPSDTRYPTTLPDQTGKGRPTGRYDGQAATVACPHRSKAVRSTTKP